MVNCAVLLKSNVCTRRSLDLVEPLLQRLYPGTDHAERADMSDVIATYVNVVWEGELKGLLVGRRPFMTGTSPLFSYPPEAGVGAVLSNL